MIPWSASPPSGAPATGIQPALETAGRVGWRCVYVAGTHFPLSWVRGMAITEVQATRRLAQTGTLFPVCPGPKEELQPVPGEKTKISFLLV